MKREPVDEHDSDRWLREVLSTPPPPPGACIDAETLAAWADSGLSAEAASAVELHSSNCSRCAAVLAAMERSTPVPPAVHAWTLTRVFRWVAPFAAATAAVAIWMLVPNRPSTPEQNTRRSVSQPESRLSQPLQAPPQARVGGPPESPTNDAELRRRDEREVTMTAQKMPALPPPPAGSAPPLVASPAPSAAPTAPSADAMATRGLAGAANSLVQQRSAFGAETMAVESIAPSSPLIHWRIVASESVERSSDGGKTWTRVNPPPSPPLMVRAVDADRAVVRSADNAEVYTTDAGRTWTPVQENSAAPF